MPSGTLKYDVADRFGATPAGRYPKDGPRNGTAFRNEILKFLKGYDTIILDFSDVIHLPSSFCEEVFGGLVRELVRDPSLRAELYMEAAFSKGGAESLVTELKRRICLISTDQFMTALLQECWQFARESAISSEGL